LLSGQSSKKVASAIASQSAVSLGNRPFVSATNVSVKDRYTLLASFRLLQAGVGQTLVQIGGELGLRLRIGPDDRIEVWLGGRVALTSRQRWNARDHAVIALSSDGTTTKLHIDGTLDSQQKATSRTVPQSGRLNVGSRPDGSEPTRAHLTGLALYGRTLEETERKAAEDRLLRTLALPRDTSYVSTVTGMAGAGGLLPHGGLATIDEAIVRRRTAGGGNIAVEAPPELPIRTRVKVTAPIPLTIRGIGSRTWHMVGSTFVTTGWTKTNLRTYRTPCSLSAVKTVWLDSMLEPDGLPVALFPGRSFSRMQPRQFYLRDGYLHVRLPDDADPTGHTVQIGEGFSPLSVANPGGSLRLENGIFRGGTQSGVEVGQANTGGKLFAKGCIVEYSFCGFRMSRALSEAIFVNCIARRNANDGFNLHADTGIASTMHLIDCEASLNGDEGASPHDDTEMTIIRGRLHHNAYSGFMCINRAKVSLIDVEIDHNGQAELKDRENGFATRNSVQGRLLRCHVHHNNGPGIYREEIPGIELAEVSSHDNALPDR
ncbi:hypothetical protein EON79_04280, partial [bacterium]